MITKAALETKYRKCKADLKKCKTELLYQCEHVDSLRALLEDKNRTIQLNERDSQRIKRHIDTATRLLLAFDNATADIRILIAIGVLSDCTLIDVADRVSKALSATQINGNAEEEG